MLLHKPKSNQQVQYLFDKKFVENRPIPFPDGKHYAYSNLFYWAHLKAFDTAEFPLHPHKGFEIMTFVLKGTLEHFDTATNIWTPINEGGFQVIQTGYGVFHAERILKGSELFQIWFDPDFSKSLKVDPGYKDYSKEDIKSQIINGIETYEYIGDNGTYHQTDDIGIIKEIYPVGKYLKKLDTNYIYSIYLIFGSVNINSQLSSKDDFIVCKDIQDLDIDINETAELFIVKTPKEILYKTI